MKVIEKILTSPEFEKQPIVLLDIGASGELPSEWKPIAKHCICIAFDADNREMEYVVKESKTFKKLVVFSRVVIESDEKTTDFYLTRSPFCSSRLKPRVENLGEYAFQDLFKIENKITLEAIHLTKAL